ncbi:oxidoreductase [Salisediminibacterium halotolerans]|uniref:oxidoreductase n=1 Tax=Salisediminibacterium halotolerans TaxID=517425 RepID=UPI000EAE9077|nr:oxidoreductase [Salisediminibacterium halotolerans]RLJ73221.1 putative YhdH/YhfP family quinone oxidoreductase [Actinophytocola xinjiangensis]RPE86643.1 putative YhdH/YhfP family quinone oxidoreductase [Salisediminibacterium halotolerans]TWG34018.1 putative YhdH/YhfP family quinone oxidoreductase [Salisediminibacterium halotolerans]GEL09082.1 putative quinone oxidoreductase YhfP [Salisediminibacterium halotolerans]
MNQPFRAFSASGNGTGEVVQKNEEQLPEGNVVIEVFYSGVNYKDALALDPKSKVASGYPITPGIDLSGKVVSSSDPRFKEGDDVICTSYELGVGHDGGYAEYARVPADWVVPLPEGLTLREAMIIGTAGFTAAMSIHRLEENGLDPSQEPILVTGSTGGVGSMAISMLNERGYSVTASTGKDSEHDYLYRLGANDVIHRDELNPEQRRPLDRQRWAAAVDATGGAPLAYILSSVKQHGAVAVSGLTAGIDIPTTVVPFILRGVDLLGIDSSYCPMPLREKVWQRAATDLKPAHLEDIVQQEIGLDGLNEAIAGVVQGQARGRTLVNVKK